MDTLIQRRRATRIAGYSAATLLLLIGQGCASGTNETPENTAESAQAASGPTSFLSGDSLYYVWSWGEEEEEEEEEEEGVRMAESFAPQSDLQSSAPSNPALAQGDIYEVLGDGYVLDLNRFRGLLVIDVRDPEKPRITARLPLAGEPLQMHVEGNRALVLLNSGLEYRPDATRLAAQGDTGATIVQVDIGDRQSPKVLSRTTMPGGIKTSRFVSGVNEDTLYVATSEYNYFPVPGTGWKEWRYQSFLRRFDVTSNAVALSSSVELVGDVRGIVQGDGALAVLHSLKLGWQPTNQISIVDVGAGGALSLRGKVSTLAEIPSEAHVDLRGQKLRAFSGLKWDTAGQANYLQTWDASVPGNPAPIEQNAFATGESIHGALFTDDKAYVSTTLQNAGTVRAFSIDTAGHVTALGAASEPGTEENLRPILGGSRLLGVGRTDTFYYHAAVSLFDASAPAVSLLARAAVDPFTSTYPSNPEFIMNPRAFSVLEGAVNVQAPGGETESGLVLVPFNSGDWSNVPYAAGVQLFTFSQSTITRRGLLALNSSMRRGFSTSSDGAAGLTDTEFGLADYTDVDNPTEQGHLFLAPNFVNVFRYGDYRVRVQNPEDTTYWSKPTAKSLVEVISRAGQAQSAPALASFEVPPNGYYNKVGDLFVAAWISNYNQFTVRVVDLSDPLHPQPKGDFVAAGLPFSNRYGASVPAVYPTDNGLAFVAVDDYTYWTFGDVDDCWYYPWEYFSSCYGQEGCVYWAGNEHCQAPLGTQDYACSGGIAKCTYHVDADPTCVPVDKTQAAADINGFCSPGTAYREVRNARVGVLDLSNPAQPAVLPTVGLSPGEQWVSTFSDGHHVYLTVKEEATKAGDPRPHTKYVAKRIGVGLAGQAAVTNIQVPGQVVAIHGNELITRDPVWGDHFLESAVARVKVDNGLAELQNYQRFPGDREVLSVVADENGRPAVTHGLAWKPPWFDTVGANWDPRPRLALLKKASGPGVKGYDVAAESLVPSWMALRSAAGDNLFFDVPGGVLTTGAKPNQLDALHFFYLPSGGSWLFDGDDILVAAGRNGILQADGDTVSLPGNQ